jgi:ribosomal protein S18 acetylase RimI-like enzyme
MSPQTLAIVDWEPHMAPATIDVLARAFAENPLHLAAFGADEAIAKNTAFFRRGLAMFAGRRIAAVEETRILGFMHWIESPRCQLPVAQRLGLLPVMLRELGLRPTIRVSRWLAAWAGNDPISPHWHLGPIGVDPAVQGSGIGRRLMDVCCAALDDKAAAGFLETDKPGNVAFYQKFGFDIVKESRAIGVRTYFMTRKARGVSR